jgi:hypothetical protein
VYGLIYFEACPGEITSCCVHNSTLLSTLKSLTLEHIAEVSC